MIGCRGEPITIILLNGHSIVITKEQCVSLLSTTNFLQYYFRWGLIQRNTPGTENRSLWNAQLYIPLPFPRLRNHWREGGKILRIRGSEWLWGNSVCWTQQGRLHTRAHSSCDSMHRTCTISSHTTMPTWRGEGKVKSPF